MKRRFLISMPHDEMQWRFSSEMSDDPPTRQEFPFTIADVEKVLSRLPPREADMVRMYFLSRKEQKDIGKIFNVSQGDVFYRLNRAIRRIKFLLELPEITREQMEKDLKPILEDDLHLEIMWGLYTTTSQTEVARQTQTSQGKIRYRFLKILKRIQDCADLNPKVYGVYVKAFEMIKGSFNAVRELSTQKRWSHKFEGEKRTED
jgi:hypothetical protein